MLVICKPLKINHFKKKTDESGYRTYEVDGRSYVSVTTFLGLTKSAEAKKTLNDWRERLGTDNADKETSRCATRGTLVHKCLEDYLNKTSTFSEVLDRLNPFHKLSLKSMKKFVDRITDIVAQEIQLYSHTLRLAGTVDCVGLYSKKKSVIDFKTSSKPKRIEWIVDYFIQTAIYSYMIEEMYGETYDNLVIIISVEGDEAQVFEANRSDFKELIKQRILQYRKIK